MDSKSRSVVEERQYLLLNERLKQISNGDQTLLDHLLVRYRQRESVTKLKRDAQHTTTVFVSQDYVSFEVILKKCCVRFINVFGVILEWKEFDEKGNTVWKKKNIDYISEDECEGKNDSVFTIYSLSNMTQLGIFDNFSTIWFLSDNAGKHLRNRFVMKQLRQMVTELRTKNSNFNCINYIMWAPNHGNCGVDAHGGNITIARKSIPENQRPVDSVGFAKMIRTSTDADVHLIPKEVLCVMRKKMEIEKDAGVYPELNGISRCHFFHVDESTISMKHYYSSPSSSITFDYTVASSIQKSLLKHRTLPSVERMVTMSDNELVAYLSQMEWNSFKSILSSYKIERPSLKKNSDMQTLVSSLLVRLRNLNKGQVK